jgi:hypothetical protein
MKVTIERHITQAGNSYKVYKHNPDKSLSELFIFDESKGWTEESAKQKAIDHAQKLQIPVVESIEEIYNSENIEDERFIKGFIKE